MITRNLVVILLALLICIGIVTAFGSPKPEGYVGGTVAPNGDMIGGHPSEEQMVNDRASSGVSVVVTSGGKRIFSGENALQFAVMDRSV